MSASHIALIVEDDEPTAAILAELVASLGHESRHASTLQEVRGAVEAGGYCYVLLDMQIPADKHGRPLSSSGETALALLRKQSPQRNAEHRHVVQILVVTGYSREPEFVMKMINAGADGFVAKPFGDRLERVLDEIRAGLVRAGRVDHEQCAPASGEPNSVSLKTATKGAIRLVVDGRKSGARTGVLVNGVRVDLQDVHFELLVRLVVAHAAALGSWRERQELGVARRREAPSRLRRELGAAVAEGLTIVESDGKGRVRLGPEVTVERIDWASLSEHPSAVVQKLARAERERTQR